MKREEFLDFAKGFSIICLLFSHTMDCSEFYIGSWITSFHMPIFFIIGGIIHSMKDGQETRSGDIVKLIQKRAFQFGIPYCIFCCLLAVFYTALSLISGNSSVGILTYVFRIVTLQGIDSLWFIPCYFAAELFLSLANLSKQTRWIAILICVSTMSYLTVAAEYPSF